MHRYFNAILLAALLASPAAPCLAAHPSAVPVSESIVGNDRLPDRDLRLGTVTVHPDIVYSSIPGYRPLLLDLYLPAGNGRHPLVVFVHGGSWTSGTKRATGHYADFPGVLARLAARGFTVASVDYRLSSEAKYPAALQDIKASIRYLRANANRFGIDRNRVAVWGASAGAHLAAMAALTGDDASLEPAYRSDPGQSDRVQAFVGWYGPYDIPAVFSQAMAAAPAAGTPTSPEEAAESTGPLNFFGCTMQGCPPGVLESASPVNFVDKNDPPALLIHGTADATVSQDQSIGLYNRLKNAGIRADLLLIDRVGHSWTGPGRKATTAASRQALDATFDWLARTISKGTQGTSPNRIRIRDRYDHLKN